MDGENLVERIHIDLSTKLIWLYYQLKKLLSKLKDKNLINDFTSKKIRRINFK